MEVECIYEKGVLRPLRRIRLKEKERVLVRINSKKEFIVDRIFKNLEKFPKREIPKNIEEIYHEEKMHG